MTQSPDLRVAEKAIAVLRAEGLVDEAGLKELASKLPAGKMTAEDWKLLALRAIEKPKGIHRG